MKTKGFTFIEMMIVVAILGILAAIIIPAFSGSYKNQQAEIKQGYKCIAGMKFTPNSQTQIISADGKGIPCDSVGSGVNNFGGVR